MQMVRNALTEACVINANANDYESVEALCAHVPGKMHLRGILSVLSEVLTIKAYTVSGMKYF